MTEYIKLIYSLAFAYDRRMLSAPSLMTNKDCIIAAAIFSELTRLKAIQQYA